LGVSAGASLFCPNPPNMFVGAAAGALGVSACCPKPLNRPFCAGVADWVEPLKLKRPLVAGVLAVFWVDDVGAPNVKAVAAGAGVLVAFKAPLVVPNIPPEGAALEVPNMPPEGVELDVPNMPPEGAALVVLFWPSPPKGLLCCWLLPNIEAAPPNAGVLPFVGGALGVDCANGLLPPAVKLKSEDDGGWKPVG
jgi:hypothetical protein